MFATLPQVALVSLGQVERMVRTYQQRRVTSLFFDTETTGLNPLTGRLVSLQFQQRDHPGVCVDVRRMPLDRLAGLLAPLFTREMLFVGHNLKFDYAWVLRHLGLRMSRVYDTMLAEQVILGLGKEDARRRGEPLSLQASLKRRLNLTIEKEAREWFIDLDQRPRDWHAPLPHEQVAYSLRDVEHLAALQDAQETELTACGLLPTFRLECRALPAIAEMELAGMRIHLDGWRAFIEEKAEQASALAEEALTTFGPPILLHRAEVWKAKQEEYETWVRERDAEAGRCREEFDHTGGADPGTTGFLPWGKYKQRWMHQWREEHPNPGRPKPDTSLPNLGSTTQLLAAFEMLKLPIPRKRRANKTFTPSFDADALSPYADSYPEIGTLLHWREAQKFVDSFGESLLQHISPLDARIHPEYQQIGASTGRMSCTRPNLQQVPSRGDGKRLRMNVVAAPGHKLLVADYSGIEMRILADLSGDKALLGVFAQREDIHTATARMMFSLDESVDVATTLIPGSKVTYRAAAKQLNYMLMYGGGAKKLARKLKCALGLAEELMARYFALYAGVASYLADLRTTARTTACAKTVLGRKRYFTVPSEPPFPLAARGDPGRMAEFREEHREWEFALARIERQGMNTPIQGTSADITKLALASFYERVLLPCPPDADGPQLIAAVHDELVVEVRTEEASQVARILADCMDDAQCCYLHTVTLEAPEVHIGDTWTKP